MIHIHSINIPVVEPKPASSTNHNKFFTVVVFISQCLGNIFNLVVPLGRLWANYYRQVLAFGEQEGGVIIPRSALTFIINALLAFAEIKSQGDNKFPFNTHPQTMMVSVTSLLIYGFTSAADVIFSSLGLDPTSVYVIIARLGRIGSVCILVASLASLFYF